MLAMDWVDQERDAVDRRDLQ